VIRIATYIDNNKVTLLHDLMHEIILIRYTQKKRTYLELLVELSNYLTDQIDHYLVDYPPEVIEKIEQIEGQDYNSEEIRLAMQLLIIHGLKHKNIRADMITPDGIGLLFAFIIKHLANIKQEITILDIVAGTGNLLTTIANHIEVEQLSLLGIENNELLVQVAKANADMQYHHIDLFFQDTLQHIFPTVDFVIGDLDQYQYANDKYQSPLYQLGIRDFSYLAIEKHIQSGHDQTYYLFLIYNDFFRNEGNKEMKQVIDEFTDMLGLIVLPESMFLDSSKSKSILILKHKVDLATVARNLELIHLPSSYDHILFEKAMIQLGEWLMSINHKKV
jgi:site-specific DNA-methyltransferase (adenine-specific)